MPDNTSTLNCLAASGNAQFARSGELINCTFTPKNAGVNSPVNYTYQTVLLTQGLIVSNISNSSATINFEVSAPVYTHNPSNNSMSIEVISSTNSTIVLASQTFTLLGIPTVASTLSCIGSENIIDIVRQSETILCTIIINDNIGGTTGLPSDFALPVSNPLSATSTSVLTAGPNHTTVLFYALAPATIGVQFTMGGRLASGLAFSQGNINIALRGTPSWQSTITCSNNLTQEANVRIGESVICLITPFDSAGKQTTGFTTDFAYPVVSLPPPYFVPFLSASGGTSFTVSFPVPNGLIAGQYLSVQGQLGNGTLFQQSAQKLLFVGTPTQATTLNCYGSNTHATTVYTLETILCTLYVKDANGTTTAFSTDFNNPIVSAGVTTAITTKSGNESDSEMVFSIIAPSSPTSFTVSVSLSSNNAPIANSPLQINVTLAPAVKSQIFCVGSVSGINEVRTGELTYCTITARDNNGALTFALPSDFGSPIVYGGTNQTALIKSQTSISTLRFNVTAPTTAGASFYVEGRLNSGALFSQNAFNIYVIGVPTQLSSLSCQGVVSLISVVHAGDTVVCTLTPRGGTGATTTAFASDFSTPYISPPAIPTALVTTDLGSTFVFYFNASLSLSARQIINVTGLLANGTAFTSGPAQLTVVGRPTSNSTLSCVGQAGSTPYVYPGGTVLCTITVQDAHGPTTGLAEDYGQPLSVGGTSITLPIAVNSYSQMQFTVQAPATANSVFTITGVMADLTPFNQGPVSMMVIGTASRYSNVSCVPIRNFGVFSVRTGEEVTCTIFIKNTLNQPTTAALTDFSLPVVVGGNLSSGFSLSGYTEVQFNVTAPQTAGALFTVTGRLSNGQLFYQGAFAIPVVGVPTTASQIACSGNRSNTTVVRINELVNCNYNIRDSSGLTIGNAADFLSAIVVGGRNETSLVSLSPYRLYFSVVAPAVASSTFTLLGRLASGANFTQGPLPLTVVGIPTNNSTLACIGAVSGTRFVRAGEIILCTISVFDDSGATTGVANDFVVYSAEPYTMLMHSWNYSNVYFNVTAPSQVNAVVTVAAGIAGGSNFTQGAVALVVVGTPTNDSSIACAGLRSHTTFVRVDEVVVCNITARSSPGQVTTSLPLDFGSPLTINGQSISAIQGPQPSTWQIFNVTSPNTVGVPFSVVGRLADGQNFTQGLVYLTVVGTPSNRSTVSCIGVRSGNTYVRVNDIVTCTITIRDTSGLSTTGVTPDFYTPAVINGQLQSGLVISSDLRTINFNFSVDNSVGSNATVSVRLKSGAILPMAYLTIGEYIYIYVNVSVRFA